MSHIFMHFSGIGWQHTCSCVFTRVHECCDEMHFQEFSVISWQHACLSVRWWNAFPSIFSGIWWRVDACSLVLWWNSFSRIFFRYLWQHPCLCVFRHVVMKRIFKCFPSYGDNMRVHVWWWNALSCIFCHGDNTRVHVFGDEMHFHASSGTLWPNAFPRVFRHLVTTCMFTHVHTHCDEMHFHTSCDSMHLWFEGFDDNMLVHVCCNKMRFCVFSGVCRQHARRGHVWTCVLWQYTISCIFRGLATTCMLTHVHTHSAYGSNMWSRVEFCGCNMPDHICGSNTCSHVWSHLVARCVYMCRGVYWEHSCSHMFCCVMATCLFMDMSATRFHLWQ